ncbi:MAG: hypothetical protein WCJ30_13620, partial [Deltaproteobacteria bacterium]
MPTPRRLRAPVPRRRLASVILLAGLTSCAGHSDADGGTDSGPADTLRDAAGSDVPVTPDVTLADASDASDASDGAPPDADLGAVSTPH